MALLELKGLTKSFGGLVAVLDLHMEVDSGQIYGLIDMLVEAGMAVLVQSSELPELIRLANRCLVFAQGEPRGELTGPEITQPDVMALATGVANGQDFKYLQRETPTQEATK